MANRSTALPPIMGSSTVYQTFDCRAYCNLGNFPPLFLAQYGGEMSELDDAGTYFDLGPRKVTSNGIFHYMCTRNNNFSNRGQKGKVVVGNTEIVVKKIGWNGGNLTVDSRY